MDGNRMWMSASRTAAALMACLCIALMTFAPGAYANADATFASGAYANADATFAPSAYAGADALTYQASNGWELAYSVSDAGLATIEGVTAAGSGTLVVPGQIDGCEVVAIAKQAFYNKGGDGLAAYLTEIEIPDTVKTFGANAFMGSGLVRITIPASVEAIPAGCFSGCSKLSEVVFEGGSLKNIGELAFSGCSSITRLDIPELTKGISGNRYRIGQRCFYNCKSLETIVFHGNVNTFTPETLENSTTPKGDYIANVDCFDNCENLRNMVYYCKSSKMKKGTGTATSIEGTTVFQTLAFYASAEDSAACTNPVYTITCKNTVKALDVLNSTVPADDIWDEWGERPQLGDDMTWGVQWGSESNSRVYANTTLNNTYNAIPVSKADFAYGWISSDYLDNYRDTTAETGNMGVGNYPTFYIDDSKKVPELDNMVAYLPGGIRADPSTFRICYQKETSTSVGRANVSSYSDVDAPVEAGYYRMCAEGVEGAGAGTRTPWVVFNVAVFVPNVSRYSNSDKAVRLGKISQAASTTVAGAAVCDVVVPASDWRYQLIGSGLAGVGGGVLLYDNGENYSSRTVTAFAESRATALQVLGSTSVVPESASPTSETYLMDYLNERNLQNRTRYTKDSTVQELADQVYTTIRTLQKNGNAVYGEGWGPTAIVASPSCCIDTLPIAQYAYAEKAPVFFTQPDGSLSDVDLGYLKHDGFENVVIAGDESYVSRACLSDIRSQCGITPVRMLDSGSNSLEACLGSVGEIAQGAATVVIAAANDAANLTAGATLAATSGGTMLSCSSTADSKRIQDYLRAIIAEKGQASIRTIHLVGDLSNVDEGLPSRISNMWTAPESTAINDDDSVEVGDYVYRFEKGNRAQCVLVRNPDVTDVVVEGFTYEGGRYTVGVPAAQAFSSRDVVNSITFKEPSLTALPAQALSGVAVKAVDLGSSVESVGDGAFEGCPVLSKVSGSAVSSIGKKAFAACPMLGSASFNSAVSVGASAFQGCTSLTYASLFSAGSIGSSAFQGCAALGAVTLPVAKSVGSSAFRDCGALVSVSMPRATSIASSMFQGCTSLRLVSVSAARAIGPAAFKGCTALRSFSSSAVTSIGDSAFEGCAKLASVQFKSKKLSKVGAQAFSGCNKLKKLKFKTKKLTKKLIGAKAFSGTPKKAKVYVPKAKIKAYKKIFIKRGLSKKARFVKG